MVYHECRNNTWVYAVANAVHRNSGVHIQTDIKEYKRSECSGEYLNNLRFAEDVSLMSEIIQDLQTITNAVNDTNKKLA